MVWEEFNWKGGTVLTAIHLSSIILVPWFLVTQLLPSGILLTLSFLICACSLSITAGYHRLYSHKSYKTHPIIETIILFLGSLSVQGSALEWSDNHRAHHRYVDTEKDPYTVKDGFWHAHMLWMFKKQKEIDPSTVQDLFNNPLTAFQHKHSVLLMAATNVIIVLTFGYLFSSYLAAFIILVLARLFFTHHTTWFINSLAHYWGSQPYSKEHTSVNNFIISTLTFGEGYHNFHHTFEYDYRNGIRWYQWDPTKMLIWTLHKLGLASNLRRADRWAIKKRLLLEDKKLLLEKAKTLEQSRWEEVEKKVCSLADRLTENINSISEKLKTYKQLKKQHAPKSEKVQAKLQIKWLRKTLKQDYHQWSKICNTFLNSHHLPPIQ